MSDDPNLLLPEDAEIVEGDARNDIAREELVVEVHEAARRLGIEELASAGLDIRRASKTAQAANRTDPSVGQGVLRLRAAEDHLVSYSLIEISGAKKGSMTGDAELMKEAFKAGRGSLVIDGAAAIEVNFVAYTAGASTAYFEVPARARF